MNFFLWALWPIASPLTWLLDRLVPEDESGDEAYNRGELSALIRIQYEEREAKARRVTAGLTPHTGKLRTSILAHQPQPDRQEAKAMTIRHPTFTVVDKTRGWRNLKREIMEAVEQRHLDRQQQHQNQQHSQHRFASQRDASSSPRSSHQHCHSIASGGGNFPLFGNSINSNNSTGNHLRRTRSTSIGSDHDSVQSYSTPPAYEQIAPPLHHAEVRVVEGALTMKTKCAWDVYTPLRMIFAVPYDLELDRGTIADIYSEGYSR